MITSGLTCSVWRSLAADVLLTVAFHVRLTDKYQTDDQQLRVSANNSLHYDRAGIHRIMWKPNTSHHEANENTYSVGSTVFFDEENDKMT
jgi:hypothetical protein